MPANYADKLILVLLALNCVLPNVFSTHFRGGVITVRPSGTGVQGEVSPVQYEAIDGSVGLPEIFILMLYRKD